MAVLDFINDINNAIDKEMKTTVIFLDRHNILLY